MAAANPTVDDLGAGSDPGVGSDPEEAVRTPRTNMFIAAVVEWSGATHPVTIRNLSLDGALIEGATMPPVETTVRLVRGALSASGTVAWASERRCGLRLDSGIAVALWMAKPGNLRQVEIDLAIRQIKAGAPIAFPAQLVAFPAPPVADPVATAPALLDPTPLSPTLTPPPTPAPRPPLTAQVAEFEAMLAAVSDALASDPATVARHLIPLQTLDLLAQKLARLKD